jgi:N-acetylglucosaminyl-diphospho-decaprenol L-rhamnosyltransferase
MLSPEPVQTVSLDDITVVIVTYFSAGCIEPLAAVLNELKNVIFVDNGSTDNTKELIQTLIPRAITVALPQNLGFGAANNRGFEKCITKYIAIVNPDIAFSTAALELLLATAERFDQAAFIAPQLIDKEGKPDVSYRFPRYLPGTASWKAKGPAAQALTCVGFASGAFLLAKRQALQTLNGFDESFFLYYEDDDLCTRAFALGMTIIVEPMAVVTHFSRGSVKTSSPLKGEFFRAKHHTYSKLLFEQKHNSGYTKKHRQLKLAQLWATALMALPIRVLLPSKKYSAYLGRVCGRISGLYELTFNQKRPIAQTSAQTSAKTIAKTND